MSKPITDSEINLVLDYLRRENRPYSIMTMFENLKRTISKPQLIKCLEKLTTENKITSKEFGKTKGYMINQTTLPSNSNNILTKVKELEDKITMIKDKLAVIKNRNNTLYTYRLGMEELIRFNNELATIKLKISELNDNKNGEDNHSNFDKNNICNDRIEEIKLTHEKTHAEWFKRKKFCKNIIKSISNIIEMSPTQLIQEIGIEDDPGSLYTDPMYDYVAV